jgi:hypothetical protein
MPPKVCRDGANCKRNNCPFYHPNRPRNSSAPTNTRNNNSNSNNNNNSFARPQQGYSQSLFQQQSRQQQPTNLFAAASGGGGSVFAQRQPAANVPRHQQQQQQQPLQQHAGRNQSKNIFQQAQQLNGNNFNNLFAQPLLQQQQQGQQHQRQRDVDSMETDHPQYAAVGAVKSVQGDLAASVYPLSCFGSCSSECEIPCDVSPDEWRFRIYEAQTDAALSNAVSNEMASLDQQVRAAKQQLAASFRGSGQPTNISAYQPQQQQQQQPPPQQYASVFNNGPAPLGSNLFAAQSQALPPVSNAKLVLFGEETATAAASALLSGQPSVVAATGGAPVPVKPSEPVTPKSAFEADSFAWGCIPELPPTKQLA